MKDQLKMKKMEQIENLKKRSEKEREGKRKSISKRLSSLKNSPQLFSPMVSTAFENEDRQKDFEYLLFQLSSEQIKTLIQVMEKAPGEESNKDADKLIGTLNDEKITAILKNLLSLTTCGERDRPLDLEKFPLVEAEDKKYYKDLYFLKLAKLHLFFLENIEVSDVQMWQDGSCEKAERHWTLIKALLMFIALHGEEKKNREKFIINAKKKDETLAKAKNHLKNICKKTEAIKEEFLEGFEKNPTFQKALMDANTIWDIKPREMLFLSPLIGDFLLYLETLDLLLEDQTTQGRPQQNPYIKLCFDHIVRIYRNITGKVDAKHTTCGGGLLIESKKGRKYELNTLIKNFFDLNWIGIKLPETAPKKFKKS